MTVLKKILAGRILPWTLLALTAAAAATFGLLWNQDRAEDDRRAQLETTAEDFVVALTNFSSSTIARDVEEIQAFAAGRFEEEVGDLFSDATIQAIEEADASSTAEIEAVFVQRLDENDASVFAVASVTIENTRIDEPRTDIVRMEIGMIETADGWRVDSVELFQSPGAPGIGPLG